MKTIISVNGAVMPCEPMSMIITKSDLYSDSSKRSAETGRLIADGVNINGNQPQTLMRHYSK